MTDTSSQHSRRNFLELAAVAGVGALVVEARPAQAQTMTAMDAIEAGAERIHGVPEREPDFEYEVQRTDAEWKEMLSEEEFKILRLGFTEFPKSSPLWNETRVGAYRCKGCGLLSYTDDKKIILEKGWAFFHHSEPNAVLTGIDRVKRSGNDILMVEAHCRRCGSHLGHIVSIDQKVLHCINGASLTFTPA